MGSLVALILVGFPKGRDVHRLSTQARDTPVGLGRLAYLQLLLGRRSSSERGDHRRQ